MGAGKTGNRKFAVSWKALSGMLAVLIAVYFTMIFNIGFHNIDIGHNMLIVQHETGVEFLDENFGGNKVTSYEAYISGARMLFPGFIGTIVAVLILGYIMGSKYEE